jgi:inhibitor of cysteine peptidase
MKKNFTVLLLVVLLAACSSKSTQPTDPESTLNARVGEEFTLILESNPTTGYHWELVPDALDETKVTFVSNDYQSTSDPGLAGGGGVEIWKFKAVQSGTARIVLGYYPPSNTPTDPERTESFTVTIK